MTWNLFLLTHDHDYMSVILFFVFVFLSITSNINWLYPTCKLNFATHQIQFQFVGQMCRHWMFWYMNVLEWRKNVDEMNSKWLEVISFEVESLAHVDRNMLERRHSKLFLRHQVLNVAYKHNVTRLSWSSHWWFPSILLYIHPLDSFNIKIIYFTPVHALHANINNSISASLWTDGIISHYEWWKSEYCCTMHN